MRHTNTLGLALGAVLLGTASQAAEIQLMRFFGDCQNEYGSVNDAAEANGECGIITALVNQFNAENEGGHTVAVQTADWGTFYDLLSATYQTGNVPDVAVMHASVMPDFVSRDLLTPLSEPFATAGVDTADFVPAALANASNDGEVYALPFDLHALLFHVNMDLMEQAGLVNEDGTPRLPTSPEEFLAMGTAFEEATGKNFLASEAQASEGMMVRFFQSLLWQQGIDPISADGTTANVAGPEALAAAQFISDIYAQGLADPGLDYAGAEQAFLAGEAGILINGTWVVDNYNAQAASGAVALANYRVADVPALMGEAAVWADSHMWVVPMDESRSAEEQEAAVAFLKFLNDNNFQWSRTGHLSVRQSVIDSPEFAALPHREEFAARPRSPAPFRRRRTSARSSTPCSPSSTACGSPAPTRRPPSTPCSRASSASCAATAEVFGRPLGAGLP
jgi:multiple sugar transport system substrate-binding protein